MTDAMPARPPGPRGLPLLGSLPAVARDAPGFWTGLAARYGGVVRYRTGTQPVWLVSDADCIARLYQQDNDVYLKGRYHQLMRSAIGDGLLISNGELWQCQRQRLQPAFAKNRVATWSDIITGCTDALLDDWEAAAADGRPVDIAAAMMQLVQQMIVQMLFGRRIDYRASAAIVDAVDVINDQLLQQVLRETVAGGVLNRLPLPGNRRYRRATATLRATIEQLIAAQAAGDAGEDDPLLGQLRRAPDDTGTTMNDQLLRDELITLFLAGHETTACALGWAFYYLTEQPDVAERVAAEAGAADGEASSVTRQLAALPFTRQVVDETMRLMPPVYGIGRSLAREHDIGGYRAPADALVLVSPYVLHRHPAHWAQPSRFDPDRWDSTERRHRYAYFPFGGGPRTCIGLHLAMLEMVTVVARVLRRYRLSAVPGREVRERPLITLRPFPGVPVTLARR